MEPSQIINTQNELESIKEIDGIVIASYDLAPKKSLNFLFDYSQFLINNKKFDDKILNWQIENSMLLKPMGLDYPFLKKKVEEKNQKYYKFDNLINQISYRLEKHGKLAPTKEIARAYSPEEIQEGEGVNEEMKLDETKAQGNANEINYYNLNDSFIDDGEVHSDDSDDGFFKLTLEYGNYSEDAVVKNLTRSKKIRNRKKKDVKKQLEQAIMNEDVGVEDINTIAKENLSTNHNVPITTMASTSEHKPLKSKKRKFGEKLEFSTVSAEGTMNINESISQFEVKVDEIIKEHLNAGNTFPQNLKEKHSLLKKIVPLIKITTNSTVDEHFMGLIKKLSEKLMEQADEIKVIVQYEILKAKIEGIFSNLSKVMNQFLLFLSDNNVRDFSNIEENMKNPESTERLNTIICKISAFRSSYSELCQFLKKEEKNDEVLEKFIPGIKEKSIEYKTKVPKKFKELFDRYKIKYDMLTLNQYINSKLAITQEESVLELENDFQIISQTLVPPKMKKDSNQNVSVVNLLEMSMSLEEKKSPIANKNRSDSSAKGSVIQKKKKEEVTKEKRSKSTVKKISKKKENESQDDIELNLSTKLLPDEVTGYVIQKVPLKSRKFYIKQYSDLDFTN